MNNQRTLENIQKEIKEFIKREEDLKHEYTPKVLHEHQNVNGNNLNIATNLNKDLHIQHLMLEKDSKLGDGTGRPRKFIQNSNFGSNKGVMHKFIKARGRLSLSSIKLNNLDMDATFNPAKFIIEKGSKPLRNGFVTAEEKMRKELEDFQIRESELRHERSKSQPDLMAALDLEKYLLDCDLRSVQSFGLNSAKSIHSVYGDDGFDENHSTSSSLKPARSLAELCQFSDDDSNGFPGTHSLIMRFEKMKTRLKGADNKAM